MSEPNAVAIVARLARRVLNAQAVRVLDTNLAQVYEEGAGELGEVTEGVAFEVAKRQRVFYGPIGEMGGEAEEGWLTAGCTPIGVLKGREYEGETLGVLEVLYEDKLVPVQAGRTNLVAFAEALARLMQ